MGARAIEALIDLPPVSDARSQATMEVLAAFIPAAHWIDRNLYCLIIGRMANLSLEHGNDAGSCIGYVYLGAVLGPYMGDYQAGYRFGKLALDLAEKRAAESFRSSSLRRAWTPRHSLGETLEPRARADEARRRHGA